MNGKQTLGKFNEKKTQVRQRFHDVGLTIDYFKQFFPSEREYTEQHIIRYKDGKKSCQRCYFWKNGKDVPIATVFDIMRNTGKINFAMCNSCFEDSAKDTQMFLYSQPWAHHYTFDDKHLIIHIPDGLKDKDSVSFQKQIKES